MMKNDVNQGNIKIKTKAVYLIMKSPNGAFSPVPSDFWKKTTETIYSDNLYIYIILEYSYLVRNFRIFVSVSLD